MVNFDPTPYGGRRGLRHLFDLLANATLPQGQDNYPPYTLPGPTRTIYRISLAVRLTRRRFDHGRAEPAHREGQKRSSKRSVFCTRDFGPRFPAHLQPR